jgi:mono/diheme cytochrome c family protein
MVLPVRTKEHGSTSGRMMGFTAVTLLLGGTVVVTSATLAQADPALIAKGEKVYTDKKCAMCHAINGKGGKSGGDLTDVGAKRDATWIKQFTKDPRSVMPNAKMPSFRGNEEELDAVAAYMASLK